MTKKKKPCKYQKFLLHKLLGKSIEYINEECSEIFKAKVVGVEINKVYLDNGDKTKVSNIIKNKKDKQNASWILAQIRIEKNKKRVDMALESIYQWMQQIEKDKEI